MPIWNRISRAATFIAVLTLAPPALAQDAVGPAPPQEPAAIVDPSSSGEPASEPAELAPPQTTAATEVPVGAPPTSDEAASGEPAPVEPPQETAPEATSAPEPDPAVAEEPDAGPTGGDQEAPEAAAPVDWRGLMVRLPALMSVMHSAAVHLPIALWLFGAIFVVIGAVAPSLRNQVPISCLVGGAFFSIFAVLTGWWCGEYEYAADWQDFDWEEKIVLHRWSAIGTMVASFVLSLMALTNLRRKSTAVGFLWRVGLIALALAVGWVGHLGGELLKYEGFFEEALEIWLNGE